MRLIHAARRRGAPLAAGAGLMLAATWMWQILTPPPLQAQTSPAAQVLPDAGLQRNEMIQQLRTANQKLDVMIGLLKEIRDAKTAAPPPKARPE
jgi:hypothetical protein